MSRAENSTACSCMSLCEFVVCVVGPVVFTGANTRVKHLYVHADVSAGVFV